MSDIAGQDIENHNNDPRTLIVKIRNWFPSLDNNKRYPGSPEIWIAFSKFTSSLNQHLKDAKFTRADILQMPISDYIKFAKDWIKSFKLLHKKSK